MPRRGIHTFVGELRETADISFRISAEQNGLRRLFTQLAPLRIHQDLFVDDEAPYSSTRACETHLDSHALRQASKIGEDCP